MNYEPEFLNPLEVARKIERAIQYCLEILQKGGVYAIEGFEVEKVELCFNEKYLARGFHALYKKGDATIHQLLFTVSMANSRLNINYSDEIWRCLYEIGAKGETLDSF